MDMKKKMMRMTNGRVQHPGARAKALRDESIIIWQFVVAIEVLVAEFHFVQDDENLVQVVLSLQLGTGAYSALSRSCLPRHNTVGQTIFSAPQWPKRLKTKKN